MSVERFKELLLGVFAGILFYLSFSKFNFYFLIFPAIYLGFTKNPVRFFSFGITSFFLSLWWLRIPVVEYGGINPLIGYISVLILIIFLALYQFGPTYILWKKLKFRYEVLPFIYVGFEFLRSHFPYTGFPWLLLGINLVDIPVLKFSITYLSVYGSSLIVLLLSLSFKFSGKFRLIVVAVLIPIILFGLKEEISKTERLNLKVALIQPAIPQNEKLIRELFERRYNEILNLIKKAQSYKPDIIFLPESTFHFFLNEIKKEGKELLEISKKVPLVFGIIEYTRDYKLYNSVVFLYGGKVIDKYRKKILVPFGEYTPFPFKYLSEIIPYFGLTDYSQGNGAKCFKFKDLSFGTPICFEVAYEFYMRNFNCNFISVLTNDGWFKNSNGTYQHMKIARAMAVRLKKYILWVNNTGPSAVIDPKGKILKITKYGERDILPYSF